MRQIVQLMLMTILPFSVLACESDAAGPATLAEHYILESANGQDLPLRQFMLLAGGGGCALDLTSGSIHLSVARRYVSSLRYFRDCPGVDADGNGSATTIGNYEVVGGEISFSPDGPSIIQLQQASVSGRTLEVQAVWSPNEQLTLGFVPE